MAILDCTHHFEFSHKSGSNSPQKWPIFFQCADWAISPIYAVHKNLEGQEWKVFFFDDFHKIFVGLVIYHDKAIKYQNDRIVDAVILVLNSFSLSFTFEQSDMRWGGRSKEREMQK